MPLIQLDTEPYTTVSVPQEAQSVAHAGRRMVEELLAFGLDLSLIADAEIVLGELAANAVEHGAPLHDSVFDVTWCVVVDALRISVRDGSVARSVHRLPLDSESARGRGLHMVDTLCDRWHADRHEGTRITSEMSWRPAKLDELATPRPAHSRAR